MGKGEFEDGNILKSLDNTRRYLSTFPLPHFNVLGIRNHAILKPDVIPNGNGVVTLFPQSRLGYGNLDMECKFWKHQQTK